MPRACPRGSRSRGTSILDAPDRESVVGSRYRTCSLVAASSTLYLGVSRLSHLLAMDPELLKMIPLVKDALTGLAALGGVIIAAFGLSTWRRQLRGNSEYDLARRILRGVYQVRDTVKILRLPFFPMWELADDLSDPFPENLDDATKTAYSNRWRNVASALSELDALTVEAEAQWGPTVGKHCRNVRFTAHKLFIELQGYLAIKQYRQNEINTTITQVTSNDPIEQEIAHEVKAIEDRIVPYLGKRSKTSYGRRLRG